MPETPASNPSSPAFRWGVVVFPGSNCDYDTLHVLETPAQLPHVLRDLPGALGRFRARRPNGRLRSGRRRSDRT